MDRRSVRAPRIVMSNNISSRGTPRLPPAGGSSSSLLADAARRLEGESAIADDELGLPPPGTFIALAEVATDRAYVIVESEDGTLNLELSDRTAQSFLAGPSHSHAEDVVVSLRRIGRNVGFFHPRSGRFLQARAKGLKKLGFYAFNFGVSEQFEVIERTMGPVPTMFPNALGAWFVESRRHPAQKYNLRFYTVRFETPAPSPSKSILSLPGSMKGTKGGSRATSAVPSSAMPTPPTTRPETWRRVMGATGTHGSLASTAPNTPNTRGVNGGVMGTPMVDDPSAVTNNDAMDLGIKVLQRFVKQSKSVPLKAGLRKSFAGWRNYTARIKKNTIYAMKIASLMRRSIQRRYMYRLRKYVLDQSKDQLVISQFIRTRKTRLTRLAFRCWLAQYDSLLGVRKAVTRSAQRMMRRHTAGAFYDWADFVARKMANIQTAVTAEEEREARKESLERMLNNKRKRLEFHWNERRTRLAWGAWARWREDERRRGRLLRRAVGRLSTRQMAVALERWAFVADKHRRDRLIVTRVLAKMSRRAIADAFYEWADALNARKDWEHRAKSVEKYIRAIRQRVLHLAFNRWRDKAKEYIEAETKVRRALQRYFRREVSNAFYHWEDLASTRRAREEKEARDARAWESKVRRSERFLLAMTQKLFFRAFMRWRAMRLESVRLKSLLRSATSRMRKRAVVACFIKWSETAVEMRRQRAIVSRALAKLARRNTQAAFYAWIDFTNDEEDRRRTEKGEWLSGVKKAERFLLAMQRRDQRRYFTVWLRRTKDLGYQRRMLANAVARMTRHRIASAFNRWAEAAVELRRLRVIGMRAIVRISQRQIADAFFDWLDKVRSKSTWETKVQLARRFAMGVHSRVLFAAFSRWREVARWVRESEVKVARCILRLQNNTLAHFFFHWNETIHEKKASIQQELRDKNLWYQKVRRADRFLLALRNKLLTLVFNTWSDNVVTLRRQRRRLNATLMKMTQRVLSAAFQGWVTSAERAKHQRKVANFVIHKFQENIKTSAFFKWRNAATDRKKSEAKARTLWERNVVKGKRFLLAMQRRSLHQAFYQWSSTWQRLSAERNILAVSVTRISQLRKYSAFTGWRLTAVEMKRQEVIVRRALLRILQRGAARLFFHWNGMVRSKRIWEKKLQRSERFLASLINRTLHRSYFRWKEATRQLREMEVKVRRQLLRWTEKTLESRFMDWIDAVTESRNAAEEAERSRREWERKVARSERFLLAIQNKTINAAFVQWSVNWKIAKVDRHRIRTSVARMQKRWTFKSFNAWTSAVERAKRQRSLVRFCIARMLERRKSSAFYEWADKLEAKRLHKEEQAGDWRSGVQKAERFILVWLKRSLGHAFIRWRNNARDLVIQRRKVRTCVVRMSQRRCLSAFNTWHDNARSLGIQRRKVQTCVVRISQRRCFSAFNSWYTNARSLGIQRRKVQTVVVRISQRRVLLAFNSWASTAEDMRRQRKVITYVLARFMGRAKEAAFYDWLRIVEDRKQAELDVDESLKVNYELSRRVALTWMKRNISFAFIRWRNNAKAYKMQRRRLETALVRMTSRVSFAAFSAWTQTVERNKRRRTILRRAAMRMSKRMLVVAFSDWCAKVEEKRYWDAQAVKIERCVLAIANRGMKRAFGRWVEQWKTARMHRRRLATALTRMTQRAVFKCFNQWLDEAADRRRARVALSRAIMRLSRRIQASVFDRWMEYTHESVAANTELAEWERKVRRAEKFAKSFGRKSLRAAFNRWHEATIERSSMRRKALNAIARFGKRRMVLTFDLWAAHVATVQRQRALANRVAAKLTRRAFAEAFHDWRSFTEARREQKVREQKEWLIKLRKAERFALAWRKNSIAFAFIRWRNQTIRSRAHRAKLRVAVNRMSQRRLFAAFNGWLDQAKELRRQRVIVTRAVMRMSRRLLAGAFYDWQRKVSASADFAEKVAVSERFLAGIKSRVLFRSFYGWRDRVRSLIEQEVKVRRSVLRLQDNTMGHFFFDWHEKLLAKRAHVEREERERKVWEHKLRRAERFILAWQNRTVSDAFSQWHSNWRDIRLERNRIKVVVARMTKRLLFAAWGAWCGTIIDTRRQRKVVRLVLVRIMDRLRATSFYDWVDKVQAKKEHSRREQDEWQVNMVKTRRFVLAWQNQRMNAAFICWQSNWVEMKRQRKILENCVKRMTHRLVFAAFAEWADTTVELKRDRNILRRAAMRMSRRQLASAFFDWHAHVAEGKEWAQKVLISERFLQAIHSGVKYRAFFRWCDAVRELKEMRVRVARVLNRMLGRTLADAFLDWNAWVVDERRWRTSLARCERFALALRNRTAFAAFARWREAAVETVTLRRKLAKCLGRFRHRAASSAFQGWRDGAAEFRTQRISLTRCAARWNNNKVRAAFDGWYDSYAETVRLRGVCARYVAAMGNRRLRQVFNTWGRFVEGAVVEKDVMLKSLVKMTRNGVSKAFTSWASHAAVKRENFESGCGVMRSNTRRRVFKAWRKRRLTTNAAVKTAAARFRSQSLRVMRESFRSWEIGIGDFRQRRRVGTKILANLARRGSTWGFFHWRNFVRSARKRRVATSRFLIRTERSRKRSWLVQWRHDVTETRRLRALTTRAVNRWTRRLTIKAFDRWIDATGDLRRLRVVSTRAAVKLQHRHTSRAFDGWIDAVAEMQRRERVVRRAIHSMMNRIRRSAFHGWLDSFAVTKRIRALSTRAANRFTRRSISVAFDAWIDKSVNLKRLRGVSSRAVARLERLHLSRAYNGWLDASEERLRHRVIMTKMALRMSHHKQNQAFLRWCEQTSTLRRHRNLLGSMIMRMEHRAQGAAFDGWRDRADQSRIRRRLLTRCVAKLSKRRLVLGWDRWTEAVDEVREAARDAKTRDLIAAVEDAERRNKMSEAEAREAVEARLRVLDDVTEQKCIRFINAAGHRTTHRSWRRWRFAIVERERLGGVARRCLARMSARRNRVCFYAWLDATDRNAVKVNFEQSGAARMIKRWIRRSQDMAFQGWADTTSRRRKMRKSLTHCVNRLRRRGLTVCFDTWQHKVADAKRWRKTVTDAKKFLVGVFFRKTFAAFQGWKEHATLRRVNLDRARRALGHLTVDERIRGAWHAWQEAWEASKPDPALPRMMAVARRMHAKLVKKDLYGAFDRWDEYARERKKLRSVALKVTRRMAQRYLAGSFDRWDEHTRERKKLRSVALKVTRRMGRRYLARSFGTWLYWYDAGVTYREGAECRERVLLVMRNRRLAPAFNAWVANAETLGMKRTTLARVAGRIQRRGVARAFDGWLDAVAEGRTFKSSVGKAHRLIRLIMTRHTRAAFHRWDDVASTRREKEKKVRRCVQRMLRRHVSAAFYRWERVASEGRDKTENEEREVRRWDTQVRRAERFLRSMQFQNLFRGFARWRSTAAESVGRRRKLSGAIARMRKRAVVACFIKWSETAVEMRRQRAIVSRALAKLARRNTQAAFYAWIDFTNDEEDRRRTEKGEWLSGVKKAERFLLAMQRRDQRRYFTVWLRRTKDLGYQRRMLANAVARMTRHRIASAFNRWAEAAVELRRLRVIGMRAIVRISQRQIADAFFDWLDKVRSKSTWETKVQLARRFAMGVHSRVLFAAFSRWREVARWVRESEVKVARSILRLQNNTLAHFFFDWNEMLNAKKASIQRDETEKRVWTRKVQRAERFLLAMRNKRVTLTFNTWSDRVATLTRQRRKVSAAVAKMRHRVLNAAFNGWAESAARSARHRRLAARAVRKMTRRRTTRAFGRWLHAAGEMRRKESATIRHAQRLWKRKTLAAFAGWKDSASSQSRNRRVALKVVKAATQHTMYASFRSWTDGHRESVRQQVAMRRAIERMRRRCLVDCFYAWLDETEDSRAAWTRASFADGLKRKYEKRLRAACYRGWMDLVLETKRLERQETNAVERAEHAVLAAHRRVTLTRVTARAFRGWRGTRMGTPIGALRAGVGAARDVIEKEREQAIAFLFVRRVMKKRINVLHEWRRYVVDMRRRESLLGDNMRRVLRERKLRLAVRAWAAAAWDRVRRHARTHTARRHARFRTMERCVAEWRSQCPTRKKWLQERAQKLAAAQRSGDRPVAVGSSVSQIAFDGWSASAMVRTAVYRDGQLVEPEANAGEVTRGETGHTHEDGHERIASVAAMAALRASFDEFDPADPNPVPVTIADTPPTVHPPPSPVELDWNFDESFQHNAAVVSPVARAPLDSGDSDMTGFGAVVGPAGLNPHSAVSSYNRGMGPRVVGGLDARYREVMGEIADLEGSLPAERTPPPPRGARGSRGDGLERLAGAESRATSALHAARDWSEEEQSRQQNSQDF